MELLPEMAFDPIVNPDPTFLVSADLAEGTRDDSVSFFDPLPPFE